HGDRTWRNRKSNDGRAISQARDAHAVGTTGQGEHGEPIRAGLIGLRRHARAGNGDDRRRDRDAAFARDSTRDHGGVGALLGAGGRCGNRQQENWNQGFHGYLVPEMVLVARPFWSRKSMRATPSESTTR